MNLKNILLVPLLVLSLGIYAQNQTRMPYGAKKTNMIASRWNNYDRSQYFSVRFGLNVSQMFYNGMETGYTSLAGVNFGLYSGWQMASEVPIFVEAGLEYNGRGAKSYPVIPTNTTEGRQSTVHTRLHYLDIPFVFKYKIHTNVHGLTIQPLVGAYIGFGIAGKSKYYLSEGQADLINSLGQYPIIKEYYPNAKESSFRDGGYRAFDAGVRLGCGLAYTNFYFEMRYDIGLYNIATDGFRTDRLNTYYGYNNFDNSVRNGCFTMCVGVEF